MTTETAEEEVAIKKAKAAELAPRIRTELATAILKLKDYQKSPTSENQREMIAAIGRAMGLAGQLEE